MIESGEPFDLTYGMDVGIARQSPPTSGATRLLLSSVVRYDRSQFGGSFEAEIRGHTAILIMGVDVIPNGWPPQEDPSGRVTAFKARLKQAVENAWSNRYALQSVCHTESEKFEAKVELLTNLSNPHATIQFFPDTPGGRSSAAAAGTSPSSAGPLPEGQAALQESDVFEKEHSRYFPGKSGTPEKRTFSQATAAHELGHLLGLQHIRCPGNEERCYGLTPEEATDIMGIGSYVSPRDYAPFQRIMERYGRDTLPPMCNRWKLVAAG
jgi:hypothetical protein